VRMGERELSQPSGCDGQVIRRPGPVRTDQGIGRPQMAWRATSRLQDLNVGFAGEAWKLNKKRRNTPAQVRDELARDLELLESVRWFDKVLIDRLCEASATKEEEVLSTLRIEATRQLSEFYYVLNARGIRNEAQIAALAELHNDYIVALSKDAAKMKR